MPFDPDASKSNLNLKLTGDYVCSATNSAGKDEAEVSLHIVGELSLP
jgi:hypothetical protein